MSDLTENLLRRIASRIERSPFCQRLLGRVMMNHTIVPAKLYPYAEGVEAWWTERATPAPDGELPVPPPDLWEGYGTTPDEYLSSGQRDTARMLEVLGTCGFDIAKAERVLDLGCAAGRMLRWLAPHAEGREYWGVDIGSRPIHWAVQHLSPPLYFVNNTTLPPLPFDPGSFDLAYCGSVFSHISDLADLWILELRRMLKPGGLLYATVQDKHSQQLIFTQNAGRRFSRALRETGARTGCFDADYAKLVVTNNPKTTMVFYDIDHLRARWGRYMEVAAVVAEAYGFQTAVVLRKR